MITSPFTLRRHPQRDPRGRRDRPVRRHRATTSRSTRTSVAALVNERTRALHAGAPLRAAGRHGGAGRAGRRAGLHLVEDAAQAHGATVGGRVAGSFGTGCFSLYATKNVTLRRRRPDHHRRRRAGRPAAAAAQPGHARAPYQYEVPGHNYRLTDLQAAIALPQLARLRADHCPAARAMRERLTEGLAGASRPLIPAGCRRARACLAPVHGPGHRRRAASTGTRWPSTCETRRSAAASTTRAWSSTTTATATTRGIVADRHAAGRAGHRRGAVAAGAPGPERRRPGPDRLDRRAGIQCLTWRSSAPASWARTTAGSPARWPACS